MSSNYNMKEPTKATSIPEFRILLAGSYLLGKKASPNHHGRIGGLEIPRFCHFRRSRNAPGELTIRLLSNRGALKFRLVEADPDPPGRVEGYQGAIFVFDVTSRPHCLRLKQFHRKLQRQNDDIPLVACGNKVEYRACRTKWKCLQLLRAKNLTYYDVSKRNQANVEKPLIDLARRVTRDDSLRLLYAFDVLLETLPSMIQRRRELSAQELALLSALAKDPTPQELVAISALCRDI